MPLPYKDQKHYTYSDYITWPENERWELIQGIAYDLSPAPNTAHQTVSVELSRQIANFLQDKSCRVFIAPFDIRLPKVDETDEIIDTVVQPDITVICDPGKIDEKGCRGAPDWVIETLSPYTASHDQVRKLDLYERKGIREYWIVHPVDRIVTIFIREKDGTFGRPRFVETDGMLPVGILPDLEIDWKPVFARLS